MSETAKIICGVPQGTILGPLLLILYVNDMTSTSQKVLFILFAEDTNIFCSHESLQELFKIVNDEMTKLTDWFKSNKLSLNIDKTNYIIVGTKTSNNIHHIFVNDMQVRRVKLQHFRSICR